MSKTINYWYASRDNEIFLDLDSNRAIGRALSVLRLSIRRRHLAIRQLWLYSTPSLHHAHMIIVMKEDMDWRTKLAWSLWLGNDRLRVAYIIQRHAITEGCNHNLLKGGCCHDLLISQSEYFRPADDQCFCERKHKKSLVTRNCQAMMRLLGEERNADYFTRTGIAPPKRKIRVPWGRISLNQIKNWSPVYEHERARLLPDNGNVGRVQGVAEKGESVSRSYPDPGTAMASPIHAGYRPTVKRDFGKSSEDR